MRGEFVLRGPEANDRRPRVGFVVIFNDSTAPIHHASISNLRGPIEISSDRLDPRDYTHIPKNQAKTFESSELLSDNLREAIRKALDSSSFQVTIRFMDTNHLWWSRTGLGDPVRTDALGNLL
ncbi:hypothetical protein SAMN05216266_11537 [Amycolatopsis marina]|uniref:Uncharacterized protein n=1 Tax=Amycolatopsis marina TaxID=490629 RepID=A0A1I1BR33_9PSEU|nr:hypothetical protein [Amycolatopsis marina]SFB51178.1 hypothetical protein SAMN05216266_11537 [Amycolatopsis marina]